MGEIVDLDAFRKQREEEEKAKAEAEAETKAAEDEAEVNYLQDLLHRIMVNLSEVFTGSTDQYTPVGDHYYDSYSSDDYVLNTYYHEAGYDDDGYYERTWEFDPYEKDDEEDQ